MLKQKYINLIIMSFNACGNIAPLSVRISKFENIAHHTVKRINVICVVYKSVCKRHNFIPTNCMGWPLNRKIFANIPKFTYTNQAHVCFLNLTLTIIMKYLIYSYFKDNVKGLSI